MLAYTWKKNKNEQSADYEHGQTLKMECFAKRWSRGVGRLGWGVSCETRALRFSKRPGEAFCFLPSSAHESVAEFPSISLNIPKHPWKRSNKQFWLCQDSKYAWSFYMFDRILKMPQVLKNQGSEYGMVVYARVT